MHIFIQWINLYNEYNLYNGEDLYNRFYSAIKKNETQQLQQHGPGGHYAKWIKSDRDRQILLYL